MTAKLETRPKLTLDEVLTSFKTEFHSLANRFALYEGNKAWAESSDEQYVTHPGVYVWWHPDHGVLRVGVSAINSRKRALEHVGDDNTGGNMKALGAESKTRVLLFNAKERRDSHWAFALEKFFEKSLYPEHKPRRS
jgi:hypothetical protein